jgi:outer membrane protein assembly factor BamB
MTVRPASASLLCLNLLLLAPVLVLFARPDERVAPPASAPVLFPQWVRTYPPLRPAWPDQPRLPFDAAYHPVVHGPTLFLASSRNDRIIALDAASGEEKWHFTADGPIRFAPVVWGECLYFVSDDGHLYCVDACRGELQWKFRAAPSGRKVLGNERLISTWPARGAPVVAEEADGSATVYFAAGIWPFMGIFLHALDARTGTVRWSNDGDGSMYIKQPHQADAFAGVAPQGTLVVVGDKLLVPGGRSVPACYDRHTGRLLHFRLADNSKRGGGPTVLPNPGPVGGGLFINGPAAFELNSGDYLGVVGEPAIIREGILYSASEKQCKAASLRGAVRVETKVDRKGKSTTRKSLGLTSIGTVKTPRIHCLIKAGPRLFAGTPGKVFALELPFREGQNAISWEAPVDGTPVHLAFGDGRLFVSTREGRLYCFGPSQVTPRHHRFVSTPLPPAPKEWQTRTARILRETGVREGYCVVWGAGSGHLICELLRQSRLYLLVIEPDAAKIAALREELIAENVHGERIAVLPESAATAALPPYLASLMVSEDLDHVGDSSNPAFFRTLFASLRPYGGVAWLPLPHGQRQTLNAFLADEHSPPSPPHPQPLSPEAGERGERDSPRPPSGGEGSGVRGERVWAKLRDLGDAVLLTRDGPLPGAADWTHEHADAANTRVSSDRLVKAPLGLLWFGGPGHQGVLPRHGHGPQPQVVEGRLFIEGVDGLRALDIYTGRLLWEAPLPGFGKVYDTLPHQPGANAGGSNYVSLPDGIYVAHGDCCRRLDPATGRQLAVFHLPLVPGEKTPPVWAYINADGPYLIGGANPRDTSPKGKRAAVAASKYLSVLDRHTGRVLWTATAEETFRNNAICLGGGRLYAIDGTSFDLLSWLKRRGRMPSVNPRLIAFSLSTGRQLWHTRAEVFGTWLSYSAVRDVLIESGRVARDTLSDEPKGMRAYRGSDGNVLWCRRDYVGPAMIHGDRILRDRGGCNLLTGAPTMRTDPLTGKQIEWTWTRNYGCATPLASEHLLTFRSGAAGFCDLAGDGGTGNFGGFRAGCTNNLIVADGVLTAPDYTRNCTCSYQNQCSLALVPMPEAEMWTFQGPRKIEGVIRRAGINLGAPGNRQSDDGTLWLEYPRVGGPSPRLTITTVPANPQWFRRHSSQVSGGLNWVAASGARGLRQLSITLSEKSGPPRSYRVRLYFVEPDGLAAGRRRFDIALQGHTVLRGLDIRAESGRVNRTLVKEFPSIRVRRDLTVTLTPDSTCPTPETILCGVEILADP